MKLLIYILIVYTLVNSIHSLKCYTCTVKEDDVDKRCATNPELVEAGTPITDCNKKYCTSIRVEYLDPIGKLQSMFRNCEDNPQHMNEVIEDGTLKIFYRACTTALCNGGTGKDTTSIITENRQGSGILYVPGIGNSTSASIPIKPLAPILLASVILAFK